MKIYFLGTCAGTEPMPTRRHMSFVIESDQRYYWFDAGEGCSYTGHNLGIDLLAVKSIFISLIIVPILCWNNIAKDI